MCVDQAIDRKLSCSYSLSIPGHQVYDVHTIIVTCSEIEGKLPAVDLDRLQPHAYLTLPGGRLINGPDPECSLDTLCFLEAVLMSARNVEHIVVCFHTECTFRDTSVVPLFEDRQRAASKHQADESQLLNVQRELTSELSALRNMCKRNPNLAKKKLVFHGWLFESEIDWVSFLDQETGLFLPLSANSELCV